MERRVRPSSSAGSFGGLVLPRGSGSSGDRITTGELRLLRSAQQWHHQQQQHHLHNNNHHHRNPAPGNLRSDWRAFLSMPTPPPPSSAAGHHNPRSLAIDGAAAREIFGVDLDSYSFQHVDPTTAGQVPLALFSPRPPRQYYKFWFLPWKYVKVRYDRLKLVALLDRTRTPWEGLASVALATMVAAICARLLDRGVFHDLGILLFCFVVASCQYSLIKSVQPDASSPTHGYNPTVVFSRPVYFVLCGGLAVIFDTWARDATRATVWSFYGFFFDSLRAVEMGRDLILTAVLCFPVVFSLGLLPQVNTFASYALEQVDIHGFGGTGVTGLGSAVYAVCRSVAGVLALFGFAYAGLREPQSSQHIVFSVFCGLLVALSYHLSRCSSDPGVVWELVKRQLWLGPEEDEADDEIDRTTDASSRDGGRLQPQISVTRIRRKKEDEERGGAEEEPELVDPLPAKLMETVLRRFKSDAVIGFVFGVLAFAVHCSTIFTAAAPIFGMAMWIACGSVGFFLHYVLPHFRKQMPWKCFAHPFLQPAEYQAWEVTGPAKIMKPETMFAWLCIGEKYVLCVLLTLSAVTTGAPLIVGKCGLGWGSLIVTVAGMKLLRSFFCDNTQTYLLVVLTALFFGNDYAGHSETYLLDLYFARIVLSKLYEYLLKMRFVITYIAPWQITWGSAFHAFAQPFSIPHSAMLFVQGFVSALLSAPLQPFLGSAIFLTSYVRPVKFWERDYNTKRVDHTNTRLASQVERNPGADDNNLNSIFYEHLTRSLQHSLCGDLTFGRWGIVSQGDVFMLASDNLNCLVHIIELGNGLVTFQVRGLEFRGTYCQQREVEAISENVDDDLGCCCCELGHLPHMLSGNAAFNQRWLAWEVTATKYVVEGYSISDNSAASMFHVFDLRKVLITYCVKSLIYYTLYANSLNEWINNEALQEALKSLDHLSSVDLDPVFNASIDEDFDTWLGGVSKNRFLQVYMSWITFCNDRRETPLTGNDLSFVTTLCFGLSLVTRRTLGQNSRSFTMGVDLFLHGLHNLFKGVFDTASARDEWIYAADMDLVRKVVIPSVRISLKLHQDYFAYHEELCDEQFFYDSISSVDKEYVIAHEADPAWRAAILQSRPHLLALRHVQDEGGSEEYKIIMLSKKHLAFRVIKVNRECVRGLWAGQQQELVYLRNRNPERGSIQNAKQALRNIINSSCDQPIGYPIYVSPLTTSYAETNEQLSSVIGGYISLKAVKNTIIGAWRRLRIRCGESCSSGGSMPQCEDPTFGQEGTYATNHNLPGAAGLSAGGYGPSGSHSPAASYIPMTTFSTSAGLYLGVDQVSLGGGGPAAVASGAAAGSHGLAVTNSGNPYSGSGRGSRASSSTSSNTVTAAAGGAGAGATAGRAPSASLPANVSAAFINPYHVHGAENLKLSGSAATVGAGATHNTWNVGRTSPRVSLPLPSAPSTWVPLPTSGPGIKALFAARVRQEALQQVDAARNSQVRFPVLAAFVEAAAAANSAELKRPSVSVHEQGPPDADKDAATAELFLQPRVKITDANLVFDAINLGRRVDVQWPDESMRANGGRDAWKHWVPIDGMEGTVVHKWIPFHPNSVCRSHLVDRTILLVQIGERFVPIAENGVAYISPSLPNAEQR